MSIFIAGLIPADVLVDGVFGELDPVVVQEFGSDQGDRHVAGTAAMPDPAEDIPADGPLGQGDGDFGLGALGLGVSGAVGVRAVVEPAEQLDWPLEGMKPPIAVVTNVHPPS